MNHIRHIAISAQEPENTAEFYKEAFGFKEVGRISKEQGVLAHGVFLSDGLLNLAILKFKSEQGGISPDKVGLHHFGILVDNLDEVSDSNALRVALWLLGEYADTVDPSVSRF